MEACVSALADLFRKANWAEQGRRKSSACSRRASRLAQASCCAPAHPGSSVGHCCSPPRAPHAHSL